MVYIYAKEKPQKILTRLTIFLSDSASHRSSPTYNIILMQCVKNDIKINIYITNYTRPLPWPALLKKTSSPYVLALPKPPPVKFRRKFLLRTKYEKLKQRIKILFTCQLCSDLIL